MACLFLSLLNPFYLSIIVLIFSLSLVCPQEICVIMILTATFPLFAVALTANWLQATTSLGKSYSNHLKGIFLLATILFLLSEPAYFDVIGLTSTIKNQNSASLIVSLTKFASTVLLYAALISTLLIGVACIFEFFLRLALGAYATELSPLIENLKIFLMVALIVVLSKDLLTFIFQGF